MQEDESYQLIVKRKIDRFNLKKTLGKAYISSVSYEKQGQGYLKIAFYIQMSRVAQNARYLRMIFESQLQQKGF